MWNFIRLENEHLNNCGQFRIVRDISIAPVEMKVIFHDKEIGLNIDFHTAGGLPERGIAH